jgi:carbon storage regulator CsrA
VLTVVSVKRRGSVTLRIGNCEHELARGYTAEIEPGVFIKLIDLSAGRAKFGVLAPKRIAVYRGEIYARIQAQKLEAARRQSIGTRAGVALCGLFVAMSALPMSLLLQLAGA